MIGSYDSVLFQQANIPTVRPAPASTTQQNVEAQNTQAERELVNQVVGPRGSSQVSNFPASPPTPPHIHSGIQQQDWMVQGRTYWEFKCPGPKGGGDEPESSPAAEVFTCEECKLTMTTKFGLKSHQKFFCPKRGLDHLGLGHLEAAHRTGRTVPSEALKSDATTYKCDSEMDQFISTHPSAYARFRLSENPRNPQPVAAFWPALFDYRGKMALTDVETSICAADAYQILANILTDGYTFYGVDSITYKKRAFVELSNGDVFDISQYRVPRTHLGVNEGAEVRLDRPRFNVCETETEVTISLNEKYLQLLPRIYQSTSQSGDLLEEPDNGDRDVATYDEDEDFNFEQMYEPEEQEDDEEVFSQVSEVFSQVTLDDREESLPSSPAVKRMKLEPEQKEPEMEAQEKSNRCPHCNVYIAIRNLSRHINKSCPENPDIDELEATRRKKKLEKKLRALEQGNSGVKYEVKSEVKLEIKSEVKSEVKPELKKEKGDCDCPGMDHQPNCLRLRGGAGHVRLPRQMQAPHLAPDPDFLAPHLLRPIIPVIQALNHKFSNRQNRSRGHESLHDNIFMYFTTNRFS